MRHFYTENKTNMSRREKLLFVEYFNDLLHDYGDAYYSTGNVDNDYSHIVNVVKHQGYYSGVYFRYFFDKDFNLERTEERR